MAAAAAEEGLCLSPTYEAAMVAARVERLREVLMGLDRSTANHILPPPPPSTLQQDSLDPPNPAVTTPALTAAAATTLQCWWRCYEAKQYFRELLYQHYLEEEERLFQRRLRAVENTMEFLDSVRLEQARKDRQWIEDGMKQLRRRSAYHIQRWWVRRRSSSASSSSYASLPSSRRTSVDEGSLVPPQPSVWHASQPMVKEIWQSGSNQQVMTYDDRAAAESMAHETSSMDPDRGISLTDTDDLLYELSDSDYEDARQGSGDG